MSLTYVNTDSKVWALSLIDRDGIVAQWTSGDLVILLIGIRAIVDGIVIMVIAKTKELLMYIMFTKQSKSDSPKNVSTGITFNRQKICRNETC